MRTYHCLQTEVHRIRVLTGRRKNMSIMSSGGKWLLEVGSSAIIIWNCFFWLYPQSPGSSAKTDYLVPGSFTFL
ncbi:hypothetical protein Hanom_Chr06g00535511 [Helianthus anomalus]